MLWADFEEWKPIDTVTYWHLMVMFMSGDWFFELMRERLTEIYDRSLVEKMIPFRASEYFQYSTPDHIPRTTVTDEELKKAGLYVDAEESQLYDMDQRKAEHLFSFREKIDQISLDLDSQPLSSGPVAGGGSNCWSVHGNFTESGKPLMACDPHLGKLINSIWYATRIAWTDPTSGKRTFITGGSLVCSPTFTYGRSPHALFGVTALNPDVMDLFSETIKNDQYFYEGMWHPIETTSEVIKVRGQADQTLKLRFTRNGVIIPRDLVSGPA
jgi:penicillin amidase